MFTYVTNGNSGVNNSSWFSFVMITVANHHVGRRCMIACHNIAFLYFLCQYI